MPILIPIAPSKFTNCCACRIPPLPALSPLIKGGECQGEGGFEADAFTNFGSAIGISVFAVRFKHSPHPNPPRTR
jgi:hypothetical protein